MTNHDFFSLTLDDYKDIAPYTRHFIFSSDQTLTFLPGQFITLHFENEGKRLHRNYSLANYGGYDPLHPHRVELAASYVPEGFASERLFAMQPGDQLQGSGPFGRLILRDEPVSRYLLIATGTGITPYRTMLPDLAKRMETDPNLRILLLFGVRYLSDFLYQEDLCDFAEQYKQFSMQIYYSRESNLATPYAKTGYVTQALDDRFTINPQSDIAYLCGNPHMVDSTRQILSSKGLGTERIRQERYVSPKKRTTS